MLRATAPSGASDTSGPPPPPPPPARPPLRARDGNRRVDAEAVADAAEAESAKRAERPHLQALGLSDGATSPEVKRAYRRLALEHHPDKVSRFNPGRQACSVFRSLTRLPCFPGDRWRAAGSRGGGGRGVPKSQGAALRITINRLWNGLW